MSPGRVSDEQCARMEMMARDVLKECLGVAPDLQSHKQNNWVFLTQGLRPAYRVKFAPTEDIWRLDREKSIGDLLQDQMDVHIPKVLHQGEKKGYGFNVVKIIAGETLEKALLEGDTVHSLIQQAGQKLAILHGLPLDRAKLPEAYGQAEEMHTFSRKEYTVCIQRLFAAKEISLGEQKRLLKIDVEYYFPREKHVFCHCDYMPGNILVKDGRVIGIIDWEWAGAGPAGDDLATFHVAMDYHGYRSAMIHFYQGYEQRKALSPHYFLDVEFYQFYRILTMLSYMARVDDETMNPPFYRWLQKTFNEYLSEPLPFRRI